MNPGEDIYQQLADQLTSSDLQVVPGKMMHAPGLKVNDKVFAFYHKTKMGFRLGPNFDPVAFGLLQVELLSPFKTKPPLKGWYLVDHHESNLWETLTHKALDYTKTL